LLHRYCGAIYRYLLGAVRDADAAEELSQEFALRFVRGDFQRVNPDRGRFRDFLKTTLYHLIVDHHRRRQQRPAHLPSDLGQVADLENSLDSSDREFVNHWREELLDRAWEVLAEVEAASGRPLHTVLTWRVANSGVPTARLAEQLSRDQGKEYRDAGVRQLIHRAREKFAQLLLEEVARSLVDPSPDALEAEVIELGLLPYCRLALDRRNP
ncbi:MAG TPA: sigma-70 family RNA polymerase sigma factor, partial [Pirellulaceae bacterium]